jgi:hypothetical protein
MHAHALTHTHIMHRTAYKVADRQEKDALELREAEEAEARLLVEVLTKPSR